MSTAIEWCDETINPLRARNIETGAVGHFCEKVSPGCTNCYASDWNERVRPNGDKLIGTGLTFDVRNRDKVEHFLDESKLEEVLRRRKPTRWFWCDMTDIFGAWVPDEHLDRIFATMALTKRHTHLVLTKRSDRMGAYVAGEAFERISELAMSYQYAGNFDDEVEFDARDAHENMSGFWPLPNVRLGVSVEDKPRAERFDVVCELGEHGWNTMVSMEPLLDDVTIPHRYLALGSRAWVIPGGESGRKARPCALEWINRRIVQCQQAQPVPVAVFNKQLGAFVVSEARTMTADERASLKYPERHPRVPCQADEYFAWRAGIAHPKGGDPSEWPDDLRVRQFPSVA